MLGRKFYILGNGIILTISCKNSVDMSFRVCLFVCEVYVWVYQCMFVCVSVFMWLMD